MSFSSKSIFVAALAYYFWPDRSTQCSGRSKVSNLMSYIPHLTSEIRNPQFEIFLLLYASPGRTAARTTYHHYFLKDSNKLQVAHNPHSLSIKLRFGYAYHMYTFIKFYIGKRCELRLTRNLLQHLVKRFSKPIPRFSMLYMTSQIIAHNRRKVSLGLRQESN